MYYCLALLLTVLVHVDITAAGLQCLKCRRARGEESDCRNQEGVETLGHECRDGHVCTIDVRCDGKGRTTWIKGCQREGSISALETVICNANNTRCHWHCNTLNCNSRAPPDLLPRLACTPPPATTTTMAPQCEEGLTACGFLEAHSWQRCINRISFAREGTYREIHDRCVHLVCSGRRECSVERETRCEIEFQPHPGLCSFILELNARCLYDYNACGFRDLTCCCGVARIEHEDCDYVFREG